VASDTYHEPYERLTDRTKELHRAIRSLMEELEAIDWYQQRADVTTDEELRAVLLHNKNEEVEHAMMTLEWLLRTDEVFATNARTYLFSKGPITEVEKAITGGEGPVETSGEAAVKAPPGPPEQTATSPARGGSLGIGSLRGGS
jgi:uncharacterized protein